MNGYLKRVASRGVGAQEAPVVPLVRSRSPIAEEDQRIGIAGFGSANFGDAGSVEAALEDTGTAAGAPYLKASPPLLNAAGAVVQRKAAGTAAATEFGMPESAEAGPVIITSPARTTEADLRASDLSAGSRRQGLRVDTIVSGRDQPTGLEYVERGAGNESASASLTGIKFRPVEPRRPSPAQDARVREPDAGSERYAEAASPVLEPSPRAMLSQVPQESTSPDLLDSAAQPTAMPRVVIGRINVEVVPPAAEAKTSAVSRPGPLTAESVSVIGPLARGVRSGRRLSLKYR